MSKSELQWVSVGGEPGEPGRIVTNEDGTRDVFTIGCGDGTRLEDGCGIVMLGTNGLSYPPKGMTEAEKKIQVEAWERKLAEDKRRGVSHGYRRFA